MSFSSFDSEFQAFHKADVIVIGAGHAGIEAAMSAANLGCKTILMTMNLDMVGQMSCNPAIGGPAKSQLVKEIDALGGVMGICADATYLQMKTLNASKGPAVRALRAQSDKAEYRAFARKLVESHPNLKLRQTMVSRLLTDPKTRAFIGVEDQLGIQYLAKAVVITTGTFLNGRLWVGEKSSGGGRPGESRSVGITESLVELGLKTGRLKTGTPPRLDGRTIDFSSLEVHPGDAQPRFFSFLPNRPVREQMPCHLTRTNERTHQLIDENLHRSPMYSGKLDACGPRYCPSIEDKVVRFRDKDSHHLFIEPEGRDTYEIYLQGFSTCLPYEIQVAMVHTLPGLERAEIMRPACAVEYDYFPAYQLEPSLMIKTVPGIFLAGQINGTSGYEEAGAQGLVAGINAARFAGDQEPFIFSRASSYIGTLVDDLVTKEINEPYRMLTSRSEHRLLLRQDNADVRLTPLGREIGLVDQQRWEVFTQKQEDVAAELERLHTTKLSPNELLEGQPLAEELHALSGETFTEKIPLAQLLQRPAITFEHLAALHHETAQVSQEIAEFVETEIKYAGYIERQNRAIQKTSQSYHLKLPVGLDYTKIKQLSNEAKDKLTKMRPVDLGQAARLPGITPADISVLQVYLHQRSKQTDVETKEMVVS